MIGSIIGAVGALGTSIYGAIKSHDANKKALKMLEREKDENKRWYEVKSNQNYIERPDVQRAFEKQREILNEQYEKARKSQVVAGGTDESVAMQKEAANRATADAAATVAAAGADYKDKVEQQYRQTDAALTGQQIATKQKQAQNTAAAAGQAVSAGLNLLGNSLADTSSEDKTKAVTTPVLKDKTVPKVAGEGVVPTPAPIQGTENLPKKRNV